MTLIITANGRESIWMLADRRLTYSNRYTDRACKIVQLETTDGNALLGYAGLGATGQETEISTWMNNVFRGRNFSLEQMLGVLAEALKRELPRHLLLLKTDGPPTHHILVSAFVKGEPRLYTIDMVCFRDGRKPFMRFVRHVDDLQRSVRWGVAGGRTLYLMRKQDWIRPMLRLIDRYERGQIKPNVVGDYLAKINDDVHRLNPEGTIGSSCFVLCLNRKEGPLIGGGYSAHYLRGVADPNSPIVPSIMNGADVGAVRDIFLADFINRFKAKKERGPIGLNVDGIRTKLAQLPRGPDDELR